MATRNNPGTALITGASTGIGAIYADRLARRGYDLILVARNRERLDALARRITTETRRSVEVLAADLNDKADLARVEDKLRTDASITMLVNNAGVAAVTPLVDSNVDSMRVDDRSQRNCRDATHRRDRAAVHRQRRWRHHQHQLHRRRGPGSPQRCIRRQQGLRAGLQPVAASRAERQGHSRASRASWRDGHGSMEQCG